MILYKSLSFLFARQNGHGALRQTVNGFINKKKTSGTSRRKETEKWKGGWRMEAGGRVSIFKLRVKWTLMDDID
jgi:hypothetical protein